MRSIFKETINLFWDLSVDLFLKSFKTVKGFYNIISGIMFIFLFEVIYMISAGILVSPSWLAFYFLFWWCFIISSLFAFLPISSIKEKSFSNNFYKFLSILFVCLYMYLVSILLIAIVLSWFSNGGEVFFKAHFLEFSKVLPHEVISGRIDFNFLLYSICNGNGFIFSLSDIDWKALSVYGITLEMIDEIMLKSFIEQMREYLSSTENVPHEFVVKLLKHGGFYAEAAEYSLEHGLDEPSFSEAFIGLLKYWRNLYF